MIEDSVIEKMREKYNGVYPLLFNRSVERARDAGELFDILEALPKELPVVWNEELRRWVTTEDMTQAGNFKVSQ